MAASDVISFAAVVLYAAIGLRLLWSYHHRYDDADAEESEEPESGFAFLTVREQLAAANTVADKIGEMEQLQTDIAESTPEDLLTVHMEWIGRDNKQHAYDLLCTGTDTASESLTAAAERESYMLREVLSRQCSALSGAERRTQNETQNEEKPEGEWWRDKAMHSVRRHYQD